MLPALAAPFVAGVPLFKLLQHACSLLGLVPIGLSLLAAARRVPRERREALLRLVSVVVSAGALADLVNAAGSPSFRAMAGSFAVGLLSWTAYSSFAGAAHLRVRARAA